MRALFEDMPVKGNECGYLTMKQGMGSRFYRQQFEGAGLEFFNVEVAETDLMIGAGKILEKEAYDYVNKYRRLIESYIRENPEFLTSLVPLKWEKGEELQKLEKLEKLPPIIRSMCEAAELAGVGPMAAVAGAVSQYVGLDLLLHTREVLVENGGDIFIKTNTRRRVGIYAGASSLTGKIFIVVDPEDGVSGICTSSGTVGHSLSFGNADAAVILAQDAITADAAATAFGNKLKEPDDMEEALSFALSIRGVTGALCIMGDKLGALGRVRLG